MSFNGYGESAFGVVTKTSYRLRIPRRTSDNLRHRRHRLGPSADRAASDEGDDGPFDSAVIDAGTLSLDRSGKVRLSVAKYRQVLRHFMGYKVETVDCVTGSGIAVLGTDGENMGVPSPPAASVTAALPRASDW
ncbi:hypothetical protein ACWGJT_03610 [Streptomyces xantholiticus]